MGKDSRSSYARKRGIVKKIGISKKTYDVNLWR